MDKSLHKPSFKLNELQATAICGNGISSFCLYVAALTRGDNVAVLNRVMIYVEENEATKKIKIVHIANSDSDNENLKSDILVLDRAYPEIDIDFVEIEGEFGPELIEQLSQKWEIPKNFMFIGSPGDKFPYHVSELGGVRLIM
ncbi:hypothetical protein ASE92_07540 [Pedobacter sp. Leaf41]|uniref:hypothetical protein n=1 Tax=Pedobacter sp. Leaf41 TaxID=1736218 RepID=UPI000702C1AF|nr:hypothetical protein [Pedobacter sp. Leaf41]KQN35984.1 hypothetical protein ASE92_07540 [Pedobacter sp. Leaf41]